MTQARVQRSYLAFLSPNSKSVPREHDSIVVTVTEYRLHVCPKQTGNKPDPIQSKIALYSLALLTTYEQETGKIASLKPTEAVCHSRTFCKQTLHLHPQSQSRQNIFSVAIIMSKLSMNLRSNRRDSGIETMVKSSMGLLCCISRTQQCLFSREFHYRMHGLLFDWPFIKKYPLYNNL